MNLQIHRDVFRRIRTRGPRFDHELVLGADAFVVTGPVGFVTGLRDWRRARAATPADDDGAVDGDWRPL